MSDFNHILIIDDEESIRFSLGKYLRDAGYVPHPVASPVEAHEKIQTHTYAVAIVDRILANGESGLDTLRFLRQHQPFCQTVLISAYPSFESASEAIALKVFAYLAKPVRKDRILEVVQQAVEQCHNLQTASVREQVFSLIFDGSADATAVYDPMGAAVFINPAFSRMFGYSRMEALGHSLPEIPESQEQRTRRHWQQFRSDGQPLQYETIRLTKAGVRIPVLLSLMAIEANPALPPFTLVIYRNATAIDDTSAEGPGSHKNPQKDIFREITHDFNNIISIILGNSEHCQTLLNEDHQARALLKNIIDAGHKARRLTGMVLSRSHKDADGCPGVDLAALISQTLRLLAPTIPRNVRIDKSINATEPIAAGEYEQLQRVLINLVNNALQAMEPNGGILELALERYPQMQRKEAGHPLCLRVSDTGCGMDPDTRRQIFRPFYTTKPDGEGTGLGLSLALEIIRQSGGTINVESEKGKGSSFFIHLPELLPSTRPRPAGERKSRQLPPACSWQSSCLENQ